MSVRPLVTAAALSVVFAAFVGASVAFACSRTGPPLIEDIVPGVGNAPIGAADVVGVYEQEHIAEAPALVFVDSRTASVVTRYWGIPPTNVGLSIHGSGAGLLGVSSCGNEAGHVGWVGYYWVDARFLDRPANQSRPLPFIDIGNGVIGRLTTDQEAQLADRFGPPVSVEVSFWERIGGTLFVWRHHLAVATAVVLPFGLAVSRRRFWRLPGEYQFDWWVVGPAAIGMVLITWLVGHFGAESWLGMAVGFTVALGVAWLSRSAVAVFAAGLAADWLFAAAFDGRSSAGWYQVAGVFLFVVGAGALAWSHGHWSRWPASFAVISGWVLLIATWEAPIYLRATLITALAVAILSWTWRRRGSQQIELLAVESSPPHEASLDR